MGHRPTGHSKKPQVTHFGQPGHAETALERRKNRRFPIQQPVYMKVHDEHGWYKLSGMTTNASANGAFLLADSVIPVGSEVELTIALAQDVRIFSPGKVVRVAPIWQQGRYRSRVRTSIRRTTCRLIVDW